MGDTIEVCVTKLDDIFMNDTKDRVKSVLVEAESVAEVSATEIAAVDGRKLEALNP
jgi:hypothetical protein